MTSIQQISIDRWNEAQNAELTYHPDSHEVKNRYEYSYQIIHFILKTDIESLKTKSILEIGPAFFASLLYLQVSSATILEPLFDRFPKGIQDLYIEKNIEIEKTLAEYFDDYFKFDEIWLFNVLQHTLNPLEILNKLKNSGKTIRIFEPINTSCDIAHPHSLSVEHFRGIFGQDFGSVFNGGSYPNFHTSDCFYGVYK
jgi:hypothetical protein